MSKKESPDAITVTNEDVAKLIRCYARRLETAKSGVEAAFEFHQKCKEELWATIHDRLPEVKGYAAAINVDKETNEVKVFLKRKIDDA